MSRSPGRTQTCDREDALLRLEHAQKFHEVAELVASLEEEDRSSGNVATSLAVLAGIAAADAACCKALGRRSRGQNHHEAELLLSQVEPGGREAADSLRRLLDLKDTAQYGLTSINQQRLSSALRQSSYLVEFATKVLAR